MKGKKVIWILVGVVALLILISIIKKSTSKEKIPVYTEKVNKRSITETISASGKIEPVTEVKISSDVSGEVIEIHVKEGQKVKKGDLLLKIRPDVYESAVERAEANLNNIKANLANSKARLIQVKAQYDNAKKSFDRNKVLHEKKAISDAEFDNALASFNSSKAEFEAAEQTVIAAEYSVQSAYATLKEAKENLGKTVIYAPSDGTISKLDIEVGERVVGTLQMAGTELLRIADLQNMESNVEVNENDIVKVSIGDTAIIEVDAYLSRQFFGVVTEIANSAKTDGMNMDQVTNFEVKISVLPSSYEDLIDKEKPHLSPFRPGMSATVDIKTDFKKGIPSIPIQAVTMRVDTAVEKSKQNEAEMKECIFVVEDGMAKIRYIKTGIQDTEYIEVIEGVEEGEEIVAGPYAAVSKKIEHSKHLEVREKDKFYDKED
jgi:HlyD family secretion protein